MNPISDLPHECGLPKTLKALKLELFCLRTSAHFLTVLFGLGWVVFARFLPAPSPTASAEVIANFYMGNEAGIRIGATLMMLSFGPWATWGAVVAAWTRRVETGTPVLSYVQIASLTISEMIGVLCALLWASASFRAGEVSPEITMVLNDMGWLMFLLPWPPFSAWCLAVGIAVLRDESPQPVLPRWVAGLSFLTAFLFMPALLPLFFKTGGFAYNGLLGMYLPLLIFFVWIEGVTFPMVRAYRRRISELQSHQELAHPQEVIRG